jgi:hypothetical protein
LTPQHGGQVSGAQLAWDAISGVPLQISVYARGNTLPVLSLTADQISYGPVSASVFGISPPAGAHVVDLTPRTEPPGTKHAGRDISGPSAVQKALPFQLAAPGTLGGKSRGEVKLIGDGALVTYGQGLDGLAVLERAAQASPQQGEQGSQLNLPTVAIGASSGHELATALGTLVSFERAGVSYSVLGSVPPAVAQDAAKGL